MVITDVRIEITGGKQQHEAELRQIIIESVRSAVLPSFSTCRKKKSRLIATKRDASNEMRKRYERAAFDVLQQVPQAVRDRLDRIQQRRNRLDKLSPERRELYKKIEKLRDEVGLIDFSIVDTLRDIREST